MADNDKKINPGGTEEKKTEPESKNPAVDGVDVKNDGAEAPAPGKTGKVVNITFNKGSEQAGTEKKDAPAAENAEKVETLKNSNGKENPGVVKKDAETDKTDGAAKIDPAAKKDDKGDKPPKDGKDDKDEKPPQDDKSAEDKLKKEQEALLKNLDEKAETLKPKEKKTREPRMPGETKTKGAAAVGGGIGGTGDNKTEPEPPPPPREAPRANEKEEIVEIPHAELFAFKDHPFQVRDDVAMQTLVESVKERGVDQPALVRPREGGGYELVAGHRRQHASEQAGYATLSCIVRNMTDEEAVLAMAETNFNQRDSILPSERAKALKMQLDAIKRQGARFDGMAKGDVGKRSNEIVAERNGMNYKTLQRYVALNNLVPELMDLVDAGKISPTTSAYQMSFLKPKNQQYIARTIDEETAPAPSEAKVKRMRDLEEKKQLNSDVIDGIMIEENKKEDRKVVLNSQELDKYFGQEKTPAEMKETILRALDEYKEKQPLEFGKTEKPKEKEL